MKPHIVLLVLDSIRAESTSLFGCKDRTTPVLESLAGESVVYSNAISTCVSTVPAHASLFTGTFVSTHDLYVDGDALSPSFTTLAEALGRNGYKTFGVCYQDDVSPVTGLHRGFDQFDMDDEPGLLRRIIRNVVKTKTPIGAPPHAAGAHKPAAAPGKPAPQNAPPRSWRDSTAYRRAMWHSTRFADQGAGSTERKARRFLRATGTNDPVFMYLHYDEAHLPYRPPMPFRNMFVPSHQRGKAALVNQNRNRYFSGDAPMSAEDFDILRGLYHGAIAFLDAQVQRIYDMLREHQMLDNTMFIVMGDHGDNVGEHGLLSHKFSVYDTLTKVPLLIRYPKGVLSPRTHEAIVQHNDLVPTVLDLAGLGEDVLKHQMEGNSLISPRFALRREDLAISELIKPFGRESAHLRARMERYERRFFAIRSATHKFIWASDGRHEAYDLRADPREMHNLFGGSLPPEAAELQTAAMAHLPKFQASYGRQRDRM